MNKKPEREYAGITQGCLDARDLKFKGIPVGVVVCLTCHGNGKYRQYYIEGRMVGRCDSCDANGFVYQHTARAVPFSVTNQIAVASGLNVRRFDIYGLDWTKPDARARNS